MPMTTYKDAGVDIDLKDECSRIFYEASLETFKNRKGRFGEPLVERGGFSGPIEIKELRDAILLKNSDGVGTKVEIAEKLNKHDTIAFDLLAMICDDAVAMGAEPFAATDTLNVRALNINTIKQLAAGLVKAAKRARVAIVGGEVAVLGDRIHGEYLWDADVNAILEKKKVINKTLIEAGDFIVALREKGFRSNGFSLIRKVLSKALGSNWVKKPYDNKHSWGEATLTPSIIYTPVIVDAVGGYGEKRRAEIKGIAHITGSGIPGNLPRCLPEGLGAFIDLRPIEMMLKLQEMGKIADREAYQTWNMGAGMLLVCNDKKIYPIAEEHGVEAEEVGEVIAESKIIIKNRAYFQQEAELIYEI